MADNMPDKNVPDYMKTLWEGMNRDVVQISPEQVRREAEKLDKGSRRRSLIAYSVVLLWTCVTVFQTILRSHRKPLSSWEWIGLVYLVLVVSALGILRRMEQKRFDPDMGQAECVRFYRSALERQRNSHRTRGLFLRWSLPAGLMLVLITNAQARADFESSPPFWALGLAYLIWIAYRIRRSVVLGRMFQSQIDALDASFGDAEK